MTKKKFNPTNDQDLTKARGVLFRNYDLYDTGGPGPGTGLYQHMDKYKSVSDFRKKKRQEKMRKRRKAMFEAIMVSTANCHEHPDKHEKLQHLHKMLTDFTQLIAKVNKKVEDDNDIMDPVDQSPNTIPWSSAPPGGTQIGLMDGMYPKEDMDGNPPTDLYYGRIETHPVMASKK